MAIEDADLMAAINAGMPSSEPETTNDTTGEEELDAGGETPAGDDPAAGSDGTPPAGDGADGEPPAGDDADGDGAEGDEAEGEGRVRDPVTGKFVKKEAAAEPGKPGADPKAAAAKPGEGAPAAKKDPINDPIPQGLKKETAERMQSLVATAKDLTAQVTRVQAQNDEIMGLIQETGASPQQYGQALDYLRVVNSGDVAQIKQLIPFLQGELASLCRMAGVTVPGVDFLSAHKDLQEAVANGGMTREHAQELAMARDRTRMQTEATTHVQQTREAAQQEHQQGIADLNALETRLAAADTNFAARRAATLAVLKTVNPTTGKSPIQATRPSGWTKLFLETYATTKAAPAPRTTTVPGKTPAGKTGVPQNQPMRAKQPAGGAQAAPKSLAEAIDFGIANANGR